MVQEPLSPVSLRNAYETRQASTSNSYRMNSAQLSAGAPQHLLRKMVLLVRDIFQLLLLGGHSYHYECVLYENLLPRSHFLIYTNPQQRPLRFF
jgi:hypothetical protein